MKAGEGAEPSKGGTSMNAEALWAEFCQKKQIAIDTPYVTSWASVAPDTTSGKSGNRQNGISTERT